jgi:hypothetical protein
MVINLYSTFEEPDLKEFISDLKRFKRFFKEYNDHIVLGGIGVLDIKEEPLEKTSKAGIYVFQRKADKTTLLNKRGFSPTEW